MQAKNSLIAKRILAAYLVVTVALLLLGYSVQKPQVTYQEFPFSVTYSYQGETQTISDVYVGEYVQKAKYLADRSVSWSGRVKDRNLLESDFYRIGKNGDQSYSIDLNLVAGYLMGDPQYADSVCRPTGAYHGLDGTNEIVITDPAQLEKLGFSLVSWEYPEPIEKRFSPGGLSLSGEATIYTTVIAVAALLACMMLLKKDPEMVYGKAEKVSTVMNFFIALIVFPFIFMVTILSEIVSDTCFAQQILYLTPALTFLGIAVSVILRRCGYGKYSIPAQLAGPIVHGILLLLDFL